MMTRLLVFLLMLALMPGCTTMGTNISFAEDADVRILFIGNSLTYVNDVPGMVEGIARREGRLVSTAAIAVPDFSLEDHWSRGAPAEIRRLRPDIVVLQQGPSSLAENREHLALWAARFAEVIREAGGEPALYMVWPDVSRRAFFPAVEQSYAEAAVAAQGRLLPAGTVWLEVWKQDAAAPLYGPDGFHPSPLGSLTAALAIYAALFDVAAADLSEQPQLSAQAMALIRAAIAASQERWQDRLSGSTARTHEPSARGGQPETDDDGIVIR